MSAEESLPEYKENKLIISPGSPESVITPTKEFQIGVDLPLALRNLFAPVEDGNCDRLPSVDCFDGLETSSSDNVIDLLNELDVKLVNYYGARVILQHRLQLSLFCCERS